MRVIIKNCRNVSSQSFEIANFKILLSLEVFFLLWMIIVFCLFLQVACSQTPVSSAIVAVNQYLEMPYLERKANPLEFWEQRRNLLPHLAEMAFKYLSIPATSVPSERLFSKAGLVTNDRRNRLHPKKLDELLFLNGWFTAQRRK